MVPEVCRLFCATANPTEIVLAETEQGRGVLGVVDGFSPRASRTSVESSGGGTVQVGLTRKTVYRALGRHATAV
jgi:adenosine/AMP kinase